MNKRSKRLALFLLATLLLINGIARAQTPAARYPIIPYPTSLTPADGNFVIGQTTVIVLPPKHLFQAEAGVLNDLFRNTFGHPLKVATSGLHVIRLKYDESIKADEGYRLSISPNEMVLTARTPDGMFRATQTIRQLLPPVAERPVSKPFKTLSLPAVTISDEPAYAWRGMHLDVSRHFFSVSYLKKFIDVLALYKFNKFHLHLSDDQGWRIEIKKYPLLTEQGAWRTYNNQDTIDMRRAADNLDYNFDQEHIIQKDGKTLYGGFYTQEQMKDVVAYATQKHIEIIPEIDMPGHMMAAIAQYPFLSCTGGSKFGKLFTTPICPCNETTYEFAQNVFKEIFQIFSSQYVHIGGDEVDRTSWGTSDACKAFMQQQGITSTAALQSYFINRMEKFFNQNGKKLIGWDEILEDGISNTAMVMYWRSWVPNAPIKAAKNGNKVIMTPGNPLYFDAFPDKNSIPNVYNFNPIPKGLTDEEAKNIIGAQANIWTEWIPSERRADYMYMPRMTALAEVLWTNHKDYDSYLQRLRAHYDRLDLLNVHYRLPDLEGFLPSNVFIDRDTVNIQKPLANLTVHYTTDGSAPTTTSPVLDKPMVITQMFSMRAAAFRPDGSRGDVYDIKYQQQNPADAETPAKVSDGLLCSQYKGMFRRVQRIPDTKADTVVKVATVSVPPVVEAPRFGLKYRGYLDVPLDGIYSFYLTCDDGGVLRIAGNEVVNNDGNHSAIEKAGQVALKKGLHSLALDFIEAGGGYTLKLKYSINGSQPQDIPAQWLKN